MHQIVDEKTIKYTTDSSGVRLAVQLVQVNCDTASDIPAPKESWAVGSSCFIVDTQDVKFLNSSGEWV